MDVDVNVNVDVDVNVVPRMLPLIGRVEIKTPLFILKVGKIRRVIPIRDFHQRNQKG